MRNARIFNDKNLVIIPIENQNVNNSALSLPTYHCETNRKRLQIVPSRSELKFADKAMLLSRKSARDWIGAVHPELPSSEKNPESENTPPVTPTIYKPREVWFLRPAPVIKDDAYCIEITLDKSQEKTALSMQLDSQIEKRRSSGSPVIDALSSTARFDVHPKSIEHLIYIPKNILDKLKPLSGDAMKDLCEHSGGHLTTAISYLLCSMNERSSFLRTSMYQ